MDNGAPHRDLLTCTLFILLPVEEMGQQRLENAARGVNSVGRAVRRGKEMEAHEGPALTGMS